MLTVTETAKSHLANLLEQSKAPDEAAVRLVRRQTGLELAIDHERPGDKRVEHGESTVLIMDEETAGVVDSLTMDLEESERGARLTLT